MYTEKKKHILHYNLFSTEIGAKSIFNRSKIIIWKMRKMILVLEPKTDVLTYTWVYVPNQMFIFPWLLSKSFLIQLVLFQPWLFEPWKQRDYFKGALAVRMFFSLSFLSRRNGCRQLSFYTALSKLQFYSNESLMF